MENERIAALERLCDDKDRELRGLMPDRRILDFLEDLFKRRVERARVCLDREEIRPVGVFYEAECGEILGDTIREVVSRAMEAKRGE